jgi:hypothetical protein
MGPYTETTELAAPLVLELSAEPALVRTTLRGFDPPSDGLIAITRVQPGEPVAGNPLGGFCEGGRAQEVRFKSRPYPPFDRERTTHGDDRKAS